jgi:hypothetical protein
VRIYIAGMYTNGTADRKGRLFTELMNDHERAIVDGTRYMLESYHYVKNPDRVAIMRRDGARVFLDSGAFSAFTLGKQIDLDAYCNYIKANADIIDFPSVLDGIGDPLLTYQNQWAMEQRGVRPLPCFHWGEDERYLEHYVSNYDFITLGGMVPHSTEENRLWLDRIWSRHLCDSSGKPKLKVHGFGMTSIPLMTRYPWFSVDSSSWVQIAFRGAVILPGFGAVHLSTESPARKEEGAHLDNMSPPMAERVRELIRARGFEPERVASVYISRWVFNLQTFDIINRELESKELTFVPEQMSIF